MATVTPTQIATATLTGSILGAKNLAQGHCTRLFFTALGTATVVRMRRYF